MTPQERGHKGITHGMSPQERGRLGAEARWKKAHETAGATEQHQSSESDVQSPTSPSRRTKKAPSRGMSPHDRGVLGAQARWAKAHPKEAGSHAEPETQRGA